MAHFAKVENGIVTAVIVADQEFVDSQEGTWIQTSYNTHHGVHYAPNSHEPDGGVALRMNFAGVGDTYDAERDAFYCEQPFPSWTLDESICDWVAPIAKPDDGLIYDWDEEAHNADPSTGWVISSMASEYLTPIEP